MTQMAGMPDMDMMMERAVWTLGYAGLIFAMWWVMMVAMMLPGAAPMLLLFARVNRAEGPRSSVRTDRDLRRRVSRGLGRIQRSGCRIAVGIGAPRLAVADDDNDELLARWCNPHRRRLMATHPRQRGVPATLPLAPELPCSTLAAWPAWRF